MYDLIIIGAGPAGLTAALYAGRARLKTLLLEKSGLGGQIILSPTIENYPGLSNISTEKLISEMQKQVEELDVEIKADEVTKIIIDSGFKIFCKEAGYQSSALIISSGALPKKLGIPGEDKFLAKGVSYCGTCDGPLFKGKEIFVAGGGDKAVEEAIYLSRYAKKVTLVHRRDALRASKILQEKLFKNKKIEVVWNSVLDEILGDKVVEKIRVKNIKTAEVSEVSASGVFIFVGIIPNTGFLDGLVKLSEDGFIMTDEEMKTSVEGIFAAGDCRKKILTQVITACSDGAIAAFCANRYLETR